MPLAKIKIESGDLPKARRRWARGPVTKIKESGKAYMRSRNKQTFRKAVKNENNR